MQGRAAAHAQNAALELVRAPRQAPSLHHHVRTTKSPPLSHLPHGFTDACTPSSIFQQHTALFHLQ
eukprot:4275195-Pleurochrysis_carterae.AAC.2